MDTLISVGISLAIFTIAYRWTSQPDGPPTMQICVKCMKPISCLTDYDNVPYECVDGHRSGKYIRIESKDYLNSKMRELKEENEKLKGQTE